MDIEKDVVPKETIQWYKSCARCFYGFPGEIWQISNVIFTSFFYRRPEKISIKKLYFFSFFYIIGISMQVFLNGSVWKHRPKSNSLNILFSN